MLDRLTDPALGGALLPSPAAEGQGQGRGTRVFLRATQSQVYIRVQAATLVERVKWCIIAKPEGRGNAEFH